MKRLTALVALALVSVTGACSAAGGRPASSGTTNSSASPITTSSPPATTTPTTIAAPTTTAAPPAPVVALVGDIGNCASSNDDKVAALVGEDIAAVALLGDIAYNSGTADEFSRCFDPAWGHLRDELHPAPGNHDYVTRGASGYFGYFGAAAGTPGEGWYSYDVGTWHLVALNSNCGAIGGCGPDSPEGQWLHDDLVSRPSRCTLAYWHHPRVSSGPHGDNSSVAPLWQTAFDFGVDLVFAGHDHDYERFGPLDADAQPDPDGMVSFVVGTGGASAYTLRTPRHVGSAFSAQRVYGVAELTLEPTGYQERFVAIPDGHVVDEFSGSCR